MTPPSGYKAVSKITAVHHSSSIDGQGPTDQLDQQLRLNHGGAGVLSSIANSSLHPDNEDVLESRVLQNPLLDGAEDGLQENRAEGSDVEFIVMNLYSKMKNLENKYIDLANFYKQELVKSNKKPTEGRLHSPRSPLQELSQPPSAREEYTDRSNERVSNKVLTDF